MPAEEQRRYTTVKLDARLAAWLKARAAKGGRYLYRELEDLIAAGLEGQRPWENGTTKKRRTKR